MITKVGSAGQAIESVIQYPQQGESRPAEPRPEKQADRAISHSAGLNRASDRIPTSQERKHEINTRTAATNKNGVKAADVHQSVLPTDAAIVETADGEIIDNRVGLELSEEAVKITVDDVNKRISPQGAAVEFSYHEKTGRYSFKVLEKETGKIIREVPPQKSLDMVAKMFEMVGLIVDEKL